MALSHGVDPNRILPKLLQILPIEGDVVHVFRAMMGLYLATIVLWLLGAIRGGPLMRTALMGEIVLMSGLAAGRLLDLLLVAWGVLCLKGFDCHAAITETLA